MAEFTDICSNQLNKIIFANNKIKLSGQFLDSNNKLQTPSLSDDQKKHTIVLSGISTTNNNPTICLTRSNLFNNVLNLNDEKKIVLQKYNQYSELNSYNINMNYNDHSYLFDISSSTIPNDLSFLTYQMHYMIKYNNQYNNEYDLSNLNNYNDLSYIFYKTNQGLNIDNYKYFIYNNSYNAYNTNLNLHTSTSNNELLGNNILDSSKNIILRNITPNLLMNFKYSFCNSNNTINDISNNANEINNVNIFNYYTKKYKLLSYDNETIYHTPPSLNFSDISQTKLLATNIHCSNPFTGQSIYYFDGLSVYYRFITPANNLGSSDGYTYSLWINSINMIDNNDNTIVTDICENLQNQSYTIFDLRDNSNSIVLSGNGNNIKYKVNNTVWQNRIRFDYISVSHSNIFNTWYHLVITHAKSDRNATIYINGVKIKSQEVRYPADKKRENLFLGWSYIEPYDYFKGKITDFYLFDKILSDTDINTLYTNIPEDLYNILRINKPIIGHRSIYQDNTILDYYISNITEISGVGILYEYINDNDDNNNNNDLNYHPINIPDYPINSNNNDVKFIRNYNNFDEYNYGQHTKFTYYVKNIVPSTYNNYLKSNQAFTTYILDNIPFSYSQTYNIDINEPLNITLNARDSFYNDPSGPFSISGQLENYSNKAYLLDGEDNYIRINATQNFAANNKSTISFWIYHKKSNYYWEESIIHFTDKTDYNKKVELLFKQINNSEGEIIYRVNDIVVLVSSPVAYYNWYHIATVHDSDNYAKLYINGQIDSSFSKNLIGTDISMEKNSILEIDIDSVDNNNLFIGINYDHINNSNNKNFLTAEIKSFYIFNDILSDNSINNLYTYNFDNTFLTINNSIISNKDFNLIGEITYFINTVEYIDQLDCKGKTINVRYDTVKGFLKDVEENNIFGSNTEISKFLNNNKDKDDTVTFHANKDGLSYFTFFVKERDTKISSNIATINIHVTGSLLNACSKNTSEPIRTWSRVENNCQAQPLSEAQLKENKIIATQYKQNIKISKKQQYANIANQRLKKIVKNC